MGTYSRMADEIEEFDHMLDFFKEVYSNTNIIKKNKFLKIIQFLYNFSSLGQINEASYIKNRLLPEYKRLQSLTQISNNDLAESNDMLKQLYEKLSSSSLLETKHYSNSEKYYNNRIVELEKRELELKNILAHNQNANKEQKKVSEETKKKLSGIENELNQKKRELEIKQKQEDAKSDWEQKINDTFTQLKDYLKPIKQEHNRLNVLYYVFAGLSIITVIIISTIEMNAVYKLASNKDFPNFEQYLMLFLPLPIAGALMWGFVFQMNRAQRQLIAISNNIHNINYIQGLLISINNLSPNINDGILRINNALDKIISNHLKNKPIISESELLKEENKDKNSTVDLDKLLKLIKTVKESV
ncbi:hypothetical protein [Psychroserpens sp. NJDZ02]|uniref:hypothetical protein n=1 Tax=Psychroserpens sp. NJDZ02 TaxID=2570561 RepID=UPI0010A7BF64|nr:hypothetical protein [Psychroserpens sp. NJDZ02]QCE43034.1 hypothetical protein E9099_16955 [Psychroserpens sp. NJDZ02]